MINKKRTHTQLQTQAPVTNKRQKTIFVGTNTLALMAKNLMMRQEISRSDYLTLLKRQQKVSQDMRKDQVVVVPRAQLI